MTTATLVDWRQASRWGSRPTHEPAADLPRRAFVARVMGLPVSIHVRGPQARSPHVAAVVEQAFGALRRDDDLFSTWKPDSPVSRIRDGRDRLADAVPRIRRVAALCELAGQRTGGAFSAWLPDADGRLRFDPTGLVKAWAVQEAFTGLVHALRNFGARRAGQRRGTSWCTAGAPTPPTGRSQWWIGPTGPASCVPFGSAPARWRRPAPRPAARTSSIR